MASNRIQRLLLSLVVSIFTVSCFAQIQDDAEEAFRISSETHKPVLLIFAGSDWCAACMRFERNILSEISFQDFADKNLVLLKAEFPQRKKLPTSIREQNDALAEQYNPKGIFPYLLLLRSEKTVVSLISYNNQSPVEFISELKSLLSK
ncbi:MAG: thioredoxin family protein [Bacteroidota bacterium]